MPLNQIIQFSLKFKLFALLLFKIIFVPMRIVIQTSKLGILFSFSSYIIYDFTKRVLIYFSFYKSFGG